MGSRRALLAALGIVAAAYAANAWWNHSETGLAWKGREGAYVAGFFLPFGALLPGILLGRMARAGLATPRRMGAALGARDAAAAGAALALGALLAAAPLAPLLREPAGAAAAHRLFALLLVASAAEVLVFLGALGSAVEVAAGDGRVRSGLAVAAVSSLAFGFFHLTYPPPWNTLATCLSLALVWVGVSLVFLASRSLVAAVVFDDAMALVGFVRRGAELPGDAAAGWLHGALALAFFALAFRLARGGRGRLPRRGAPA
jgi:hypothetical protein